MRSLLTSDKPNNFSIGGSIMASLNDKTFSEFVEEVIKLTKNGISTSQKLLNNQFLALSETNPQHLAEIKNSPEYLAVMSDVAKQQIEPINSGFESNASKQP